MEIEAVDDGIQVNTSHCRKNTCPSSLIGIYSRFGTYHFNPCQKTNQRLCVSPDFPILHVASEPFRTPVSLPSFPLAFLSHTIPPPLLPFPPSPPNLPPSPPLHASPHPGDYLGAVALAYLAGPNISAPTGGVDIATAAAALNSAVALNSARGRRGFGPPGSRRAEGVVFEKPPLRSIDALNPRGEKSNNFEKPTGDNKPYSFQQMEGGSCETSFLRPEPCHKAKTGALQKNCTTCGKPTVIHLKPQPKATFGYHPKPPPRLAGHRPFGGFKLTRSTKWWRKTAPLDQVASTKWEGKRRS